MKILVEQVRLFKESRLIEKLEKVIKAANKSGDTRRTKAANNMQIEVANLKVFLSVCVTWKIKNGCYVVPANYLGLAKTVSLFIPTKTRRFPQKLSKWLSK